MTQLSSSSRRGFLQSTLLAALATAARSASAADRPPRILLRSSWQTVNIGDIGHTPGVIRLLEQYLPEAEFTLWPSNIGNGVEDLLRRRFPKLRFAQSKAEVAGAFEHCDFLLHGSGASLVATKNVAQWKAETKKPYGIYGITISTVDDTVRDLLTSARFAFFRDGVSLQLAKDNGVACPVMEFGPDGAFAVDLRNDDAATKFLEEHQLEPGKFLCCIPRLRYTPYWKIRNKPMTAEDDRKHLRNEEMKEHDHAPLRAAITAVVRETDHKVLLCPEDESQMAVGRAMVFDPLPDSVKSRVVWREKYWLTDEALSTYVRSSGLFGLEMHSPIMCIGNGVPALVGRFAEQTSKGFMWRDIGLGDWLFDLDSEVDAERYPKTVLTLVQDPEGAKKKVAAARKIVEERQQATMAVLAKCLGTV